MNSYYANQLLIVFVVATAIAGCSDSTPPIDTGRWYTGAQVDQGRVVFQTHCASCHGTRAEGTTEWRKTGADGNYPPPPLNGSAHAWHHPLSVLERTIAAGGVPLGGVMPGFAGILTAEEIRTSIAFFQSQWSDEIYARWRDIDAQ